MNRVLFALFFGCPAALHAETLTAVRVLRPLAVIAPGDLAVLDTRVPGALAQPDDAIGLEARVTLYPGQPIMPAHVGPPALIERNQPVTLMYRTGGLMITAEARALSRGAAGDTVRVMNMASRNTVAGTVRPDGSVEVTLWGSSR